MPSAVFEWECSTGGQTPGGPSFNHSRRPKFGRPGLPGRLGQGDGTAGARRVTMVDTAAQTLRAGARNDLVTQLLGIWLLLAVFLDGWAHLHLPGLETFFTPW